MWQQNLVLKVNHNYVTATGLTSAIENAFLFAATDDPISTITDPDPDAVYMVIPVYKYIAS